MSLTVRYFFTKIGNKLEPGRGGTFDEGCGSVWTTQRGVN